MSNIQSRVHQAVSSGEAEMYAGEQLHTEVRLNDGTQVLLRPIHPKDSARERRFIEALSPTTRRYRFLETMNSPSEALLKLITNINPATDAAYVAVLGTGEKGGRNRCWPTQHATRRKELRVRGDSYR